MGKLGEATHDNLDVTLAVSWGNELFPTTSLIGMSTEAMHSFNVCPQLYHFHSSVQHEEYLASLVDQVHHCGLSVSRNLAEDAAAAAESKALQTFGSCSDTIPCMRQVGLSVHNVPMDEVGSHVPQIT